MPASVTRIHAEKRTAKVSTSVSPRLKRALIVLARIQNRSESDLTNHVLDSYAFGMAGMLDVLALEENDQTAALRRTAVGYGHKGRG